MPWFAEAPDDGRAVDVEIERYASLPPRHGGRRLNHGEVFADGTRFTLDGATIDMVDGRYVRWIAPDASQVPLPVCSTVAAHLLAWRGLTPLHGSAVAIDGRAILIAGPSGAGKSTLAQALVNCGGQLVSDDLSVLLPQQADNVPKLLPGRPAIRLNDEANGHDHRAKRLALPPRVDPDRPVPLALLLLLQREPVTDDAAAAASNLIDQMFRPKWMRALPHAKARFATLLHASSRIGIEVMPPASDVPEVTPAARAAAAITLLHRHLEG